MRPVASHTLAFLAGAAVAGGLAAALLQTGDGTATIVVHNVSGQTLDRVLITNHETNGVVLVQDLGPGDTSSVGMFVRDEGSYAVRVELEGGRSLEVQRRVRAGAQVEERISDEAVRAVVAQP